MKAVKVITSCAAAIMLTTNVAYADEQLRGAVTAVSHVAAGVAADTPHNGFRWAEAGHDKGPAVNVPAENRRSGFRWASHPSTKASGQTAAVKHAESADQTGSRWVIRNDASQTGSRWVIRNDASQAGSRWVIRNDATQTGYRWVIRNDADQAGSRWVIR